MSKINRWTLTIALIIGLMACFSTPAIAGKSTGVDNATNVRIQKAYGKLPLSFIENNGQINKKVKFYEKGKGHTTFFTKEGVYLSLIRSQEPEVSPLSPGGEDWGEGKKIRNH
jgi:hypothetical protein